MSRPQGHSAIGRIKSLKNSSDPIGNRTRNLPACSAVPQPTASLRTPQCLWYLHYMSTHNKSYRYIYKVHSYKTSYYNLQYPSPSSISVSIQCNRCGCSASRVIVTDYKADIITNHGFRVTSNAVIFMSHISQKTVHRCRRGHLALSHNTFLF
jgi:hypothetical protein